MKPMAPSTKSMLLRHSLHIIEQLTSRLGTCSLDDFNRVKDALREEKAAFAILEAAPVKPRRARC